MATTASMCLEFASITHSPYSVNFIRYIEAKACACFTIIIINQPVFVYKSDRVHKLVRIKIMLIMVDIIFQPN
ncbi:hypothetical protein DERF_006793 [Dermatophagoides farinae]|uniref:Uncharacterized protein n=1 Tax=Dermatophagoides farinae TaxID=6954 RepID=A0A922L5D7_DERFA|nr:hypothetical protein DERF_006793 [Dermatophagoides farinae]